MRSLEVAPSPMWKVKGELKAVFEAIKRELERARKYRARDEEYAKECTGEEYGARRITWKERTLLGKILLIIGVLFLALGFVMIWKDVQFKISDSCYIMGSNACMAAAYLCITLMDYPIYKRQKRYSSIVCNVFITAALIERMFIY